MQCLNELTLYAPKDVAATLWTPESVLGPNSLNDRFRALKLSGFERELNFRKSHVIFGDPSQVTP